MKGSLRNSNCTSASRRHSYGGNLDSQIQKVICNKVAVTKSMTLNSDYSGVEFAFIIYKLTSFVIIIIVISFTKYFNLS